jgi:ribosomal protein S19
MSRSKWKGHFLTNRLLKKNKLLKKRNISIWERNSTIPFYLVGKSVFIHNGKSFFKIFISREKVGFKFGEFVYTKKHTPKPPKKVEKKTK